jgi:hypothetical protein
MGVVAPCDWDKVTHLATRIEGGEDQNVRRETGSRRSRDTRGWGRPESSVLTFSWYL